MDGQAWAGNFLRYMMDQSLPALCVYYLFLKKIFLPHCRNIYILRSYSISFGVMIAHFLLWLWYEITKKISVSVNCLTVEIVMYGSL